MRLAAVLLIGASLLEPCAAAPASEPAPERREQLEYLLRHDCGSCHGMQFKGGLGPPLLPATLAGRDDDALAWIVLNGLPGTAMPPWKGLLDETDARWLIRTLKRKQP